MPQRTNGELPILHHGGRLLRCSDSPYGLGTPLLCLVLAWPLNACHAADATSRVKLVDVYAQQGPQEAYRERLPRDAVQDRWLEAAYHARATRDWARTAELLQRVLDAEHDVIVPEPRRPAPAGLWVSARALARWMIADSPETLRQAQQQFSEQAAGLWRTESDPRPSLAIQAARRFPYSLAGQAAAAFLVASHCDRGEFATATYWLDRLEEFRAPVTRTPAMQSLTAWIRSARSEESRVALRPGALPAANQNLQPPLVRRWRRPLSEWSRLNQYVDKLLESARYMGVSPLPQFNVAKHDQWLAVRSLRGITTYSLADGRVVWESNSSRSAENSLLEQLTLTERPQWPWPTPYDELDLQQDPVGNILFRDGLYGGLGSQHDRLYAIEEMALLPNAELADSDLAGRRDDNRDFAGNSRRANRLTAYDWRTGQTLWQTGGGILEPLFLNPDADSFYHGLPLCDQHELLAVVTQQDRVDLVSLEPETGVRQWTQPLGRLSIRIDRDPVRRRQAVQPVVTDGVIVTSSSLGWLLGLERSTREILWVQRYLPDPAASPDGEAWQPDAMSWHPLTGHLQNQFLAATGPTVVFAAPDADTLRCVRAWTGEVQWSISLPGSSLEMIRAGKDRLAAFADEQVHLLNVSNGVIEASIEMPHGKGFVQQERIWIPSPDGAFRVYEALNGKLLQMLAPPWPKPPAGRWQHTGTDWIAWDAMGIEVWSSNAANPPAELISSESLAQVEELLQAGHIEQADQRIRVWTIEPREALLAVHWSRLRRETLKRAREHGTLTDAESAWLQHVTQPTPIHPWAARLSAFQQSTSKGDLAASLQLALQAWRDSVANPNASQISQPDTPALRCHSTLFWGGQIRELIAQATPQQQPEFEAQLDQLYLEQITAAALRNFRKSFGDAARFGHVPLREGDAAHAVGDGWWAEQAWLAGTRQADPAIRLAAFERLAKLYQDLGSAPLYDWAMNNGVRRIPPEVIPWGGTMRGPNPGNLADRSPPPAIVGRMEGAAAPMGGRLFFQELPFGPPAPWRLEAVRNGERVLARPWDRDETRWSLGLGMLPYSDSQPQFQVSGQLGLVQISQGIVVLDCGQGRIRWRREIHNFHREDEIDVDPAELLPADGVTFLSEDPKVWTLDDQLLIRRPRSLVALDVVTGQEDLVMESLSPEATITVAAGLLMKQHATGGLNDDDSSETPAWELFRLSDGRRLSEAVRKKLLASQRVREELLAHPLATAGHVCVSVESRQRSVFFIGTARSIRLTATIPLTGESVWQLDLAGNYRVRQIDRETLVVWRHGANAGKPYPPELIDVRTGVRTPLALPAEANGSEWQNMSVLASGDRVLAFVSGETAYESQGATQACTYVDGSVIVWQRSSGAVAWTTKLANQWFVHEGWEQRPYLLFSSLMQRWHEDLLLSHLQLTVIHKTTGAVWLNQRFPAMVHSDLSVIAGSGPWSTELFADGLRILLSEPDQPPPSP